jgi:hypothetical protein
MSAREPSPADEAQHPDEATPHWSESWYFDAVSDDGTLGVYVRLGRVPGRGSSLYTAAIVLPGRETVLVVDADAPLPDDERQTVRTATLLADQECLVPLRSHRVGLQGTGTSYDDHSAPLRPEPGVPVEVAVDLVWETDGTPYQWQLTTRYEIPCRVSGTVRVGAEIFTFAGPGQRDHSWGPRDWWGHEWMWSAFHLTDGTRIHAVTLSDLPGLMIGYVQRGPELVELTAGTSSGEQGIDGLVRGELLVLGDVGLELTVEPTGFGPLRLVSDEGRVAWFTRAMATVRTSDGREGVGWIEWNRVRPDHESSAVSEAR